MLRPIDMTLTIQGTSEAVRAGAQGLQAARPEVASQMFADRLEKQVRMQEQQVNKTPETEKNDVNPDKEGHGGGYRPKRKPVQKKPEKPKMENPKPSGESLYDIKV
ncbi:MAG: hypothetical protein FWE27_05150 [Defluviitaleaceae bacterium]|nr:hypothetical protein [Defluviitaleaceae bacterium]